MAIIKSCIKIFIVLFLLAACRPFMQKPEYYHITGKTQGSEYNITYENTIKQNLSNPINRNETMHADSMLIEVLKLSGKIWETTNGAFDITIGPLVKAWGFGPEGLNVKKNNRPDTLLKYVGFEKLNILGNKIEKKWPQMYIDLNAIAQGYTVDVIAQYFNSLGIKNYLIEVGGEIRATGKNPNGKKWRIGIDKPNEENQHPGSDIQAIIELNNSALATSGNYRKFYESDGIKYSHTINPKTGLPVRTKLLSATITAPDCATADAFATACMVLGLENAIELINSQPHIEGYFIYGHENGQYATLITQGLKQHISE
jgi:thiamine biosynthesis lipoprotein